jgi:hypothetical protein
VSGERWSVEQVMAVAPSASAFATAEPLADPGRWSALGADARAVWGRCRGSGREPYDTMVDHLGVAWRCSCPSRKLPCKHAIALLLMWARGDVAESVAPVHVAAWTARRAERTAPETGSPDPPSPGPSLAGSPASPTDSPPSPAEPPPDRDGARDDRVARMRQGLVELDRWLDDRMRTGLADPSLARYATWDELAARLVDARAGALANRVRRLAGLVGAGPDWHAQVLAELGLLHLLAQAGLRVPDLPGDLADAVATTTGWQVRQADVLAGVPETDHWVVAGRSDTREDRIEVRRVWLWGRSGRRWAMVLSFAAYGQSLDTSLEVGTSVEADVFRYPGGALRALVGERRDETERPSAPDALDVVAACDAIGRSVACEPWLERLGVTVLAAPTVVDGRWVLTDHTGSLPLIGSREALAALLAASLGETVPLTVEWTPHGVMPLTVHLPDRALDVGPRADASFVTRR